MVITREHINGCNRYTLDGKKITRTELEIYCGKYLSGYGLRSMFNRLNEQSQLIIDVDARYVYQGVAEMYASDELESAKRKIAQLEDKLAAIQDACNT